MGTWHQDRAQKRNPVPYWHETKWTVVEDPPNGCRCFSRFDTFAEADAYNNKMKAKGSYIIPPMSESMTKRNHA